VQALNKLTGEIRVGVNEVKMVDSRDTWMCTWLTLPMSPADIASFISNQPRHRGSSVSGVSSDGSERAPARGGRQQ
jgi:hypothetical protein